MKQKRKLHIEELDSFEIFDFLDNSKETEHLPKKTYLYSEKEYRKTNLLSIIRANHALINELDEYLCCLYFYFLSHFLVQRKVKR